MNDCRVEDRSEGVAAPVMAATHDLEPRVRATCGVRAKHIGPSMTTGAEERNVQGACSGGARGM